MFRQIKKKSGGARPGAGRPRKIAAAAVEILGPFPFVLSSIPDEDPLDFMLRVMRHDQVPLTLRCTMAEKAAPYCHAKISPKPEKDEEQVQPVVKTGLEALLN